MRNVVNLNTLDMHSTAILRPPSCPFFAFPFSIIKLNLQTAHTFTSKYYYLHPFVKEERLAHQRASTELSLFCLVW